MPQTISASNRHAIPAIGDSEVHKNEFPLTLKESALKHLISGLFVLYAMSLASSMAGMEIFGSILSFAGLVAAISGRVPLRRSGVEWVLLLFSVVVFIGACLAADLPLKLRIDVAGQLRWILLLYALTMFFTQFADWQKRFVDLLLALYVIVAVYGIYQAFTGDLFFGILSPVGADTYAGHTFFRARGFFSNTMSYSYCLGQCLAMAFGFFLCSLKSKSPDKKNLAFFVAMAIGLVFTFTRGAWVGTGVALLAMSFLYNWRVGLWALAAVVAVVGVAAFASPAVHERLITISQSTPDQSVAQRYDLWRANWEMFKDHPWFGIGYGYNYYFTPEYNLRIFGHPAFVAQAHNNFLQVIAGCGIIGFFCWLYFCGYFIWLSARTFWQNRHKDSWLAGISLAVFGAQIFFHVGGLTQSTFFDAKPLYILLCEWAVLIAAIGSQNLRMIGAQNK